MAAKYSRIRSGLSDGNSVSASESDESIYPRIQSGSADESMAEGLSSIEDPDMVRICPEDDRLSERMDSRWKMHCLAHLFCCIVPAVLLLAMILAASAHAFG